MKTNRLRRRVYKIGFLHNLELWWKKLEKKYKSILVAMGLCLGVLIVVLIWKGFFPKEKSVPAISEKVVTAIATPTPSPAPAKATMTPKPTPKPEEGIYTYLQGPKSWGQRLQWSGEWGVTYYDGGSFGGFGCGLCCIANVYSSLTKYQCTPVDAYHYAKKETGYGGGGAIDWGYMRRTLSSMGFDCKVHRKPASYEKFKEQIRKNKASIVLVSSNNSTCYWKNTPGHYVTIFLYDEKTEKVFLADSGDPNHNRHWVSLKKIYSSLKTASPWQFLSVTDYEEKSDTWKHKSAKGNWVKES